MTFRDEYKREMNSVKADEAVVENILLKMHREMQSPTPLIRRIPVSRIASAAAGICLLIAAAVLIPVVLRGAPFAENDATASELMLAGETSSSDMSVAEAPESADYIFDVTDNAAPDGLFTPADAFSRADYDSDDDAADFNAEEQAPRGGGIISNDWLGSEPQTDTLPPPGIAPAPESEPPTVVGDSSPPVSAEEWMQYWLHYYEYYDYQTYRDWDGGGIWDNLDGFPNIDFPLILPEWVQNLPDDVIWDSPASELSFGTLGEALGYFLSEEHRIAYIDYYYTLDEFADSFGGHLDFYDRTLDEAAPIYSMLSRNMNSGLITSPSFYLGSISISILGNDGFVHLNIRPCNGLTFSSSGTHLSYKLEDGTFEKLLSYLISIE
jgi:hypothetical protein